MPTKNHTTQQATEAGRRAYIAGWDSTCPSNIPQYTRLYWFHGYYDARIEHRLGHIFAKYQHGRINDVNEGELAS